MATLKTDRRFKQRHVLRTVALLVPPLLAFVFVARARERSGPAWWWAIGFFVAWIVAWIFVDGVVLRGYRCPSCRRKLMRPTIPIREPQDPIRYHCARCDVEWDTGLRESGE